MGYDELRRVFDYLHSEGIVGPHIAGKASSGLTYGNSSLDKAANGSAADVVKDGDLQNRGQIEVCVIDADDLLENPQGIIQAYCRSVGIPYDAEMLKWDDEADQEHAQETFAKWKGFHEDAIESRGLQQKKLVSDITRCS